MSKKKLAVVFPGVGYHVDKPLLYYSRRLAKEKGYEVVEISYDFPYKPNEIKDDPVKMEETFEIAARQAMEQLSHVDFDEFDKILFIGKSIGTAIGAYFDEKYEANAFHVVLTPVPQTFEFLQGKDGVVFHGLSDPWCENDLVTDKCEELGIELIEVKKANHSLETGNALKDIKILKKYLKVVREFF